jgi:hypothetical protein
MLVKKEQIAILFSAYLKNKKVLFAIMENTLNRKKFKQMKNFSDPLISSWMDAMSKNTLSHATVPLTSNSCYGY